MVDAFVKCERQDFGMSRVALVADHIQCAIAHRKSEIRPFENQALKKTKGKGVIF